MSQELVPEEARGMVSHRMFGNLKVYKANQFKRQGLFWLVVGKGGVGKTTFIAGARKSQYGTPFVLLECDQNAHVLSGPNYDDIEVIPIREYTQFLTFMREIQRGSDWKTICIDPITELVEMALKYYEVKIHSQDPRQHYAAETRDILEHMRTLKRLTQSAGISVIMTAWEDEWKDEATNVIHSGIKVNPAARAGIEGIVTTIGYYKLGASNQRLLDLTPSNRTAIKFGASDDDVARSIPPVVKNPDMARILDCLIGGVPYAKEA